MIQNGNPYRTLFSREYRPQLVITVLVGQHCLTPSAAVACFAFTTRGLIAPGLCCRSCGSECEDIDVDAFAALPCRCPSSSSSRASTP